ncbi:UDP-N-acetylmuramate--L-alanine ligase [Thermosulfuriphilus sp.]
MSRKDSQRIHLLGICGTGMGALAGLLKSLGHVVTGSDVNVYPPMSETLAELGIPIYPGWRPENIILSNPDLAIIGNVIRRDNPEAQEILIRGIPYLSMPQAINRFFLSSRRPLVVAGTHGKTTTSSLLLHVLAALGLDPGGLVGGVVKSLGGNFRVGQGDFFVLEGDEYDSAFFDKVPKFFHYDPYGAILTSVEFDHADIYASLEEIIEAFAGFVGLVSEDGLLVYWADSPLVEEIVRRSRARKIAYGQGQKADFVLVSRSPLPGGQILEVRTPEGELEFFLPLIGRHNALNALAVLALVSSLGLDAKAVALAMGDFSGVKRRQEIRGEARGAIIIDDFAHHPTAVRETIAAVRESWPDRRLIAVFEPRTNTSRRRIFQEVYPEALSGADLVVVRRAPGISAIPKEERFSSEKLAHDIEALGTPAQYFPDTEAIVEFLLGEVRAGDIVLIMSNGGFDNIHSRLLADL